MKKCKKCLEEKELCDFQKNRFVPSGYMARCKQCIKIAKKTYNIDLEKRKAAIKRTTDKNREKIRERARIDARKNREKRKNYIKEYYKANKDKWKYDPNKVNKEAKKQYAIKNKDKIKTYQKQYNIINYNRISEKKKLYKKNNKAKISAINNSRRIKKVQATFKHLLSDIEIIYKKAEELKKNGKSVQVDHIIPINHPLVCGLHNPWNLQILDTVDNLKKSNYFDGTYENESWKNL
jgi:hypothetical protein